MRKDVFYQCHHSQECSGGLWRQHQQRPPAHRRRREPPTQFASARPFNVEAYLVKGLTSLPKVLCDDSWQIPCDRWKALQAVDRRPPDTWRASHFDGFL
eukprot:s451_g15.t1